MKFGCLSLLPGYNYSAPVFVPFAADKLTEARAHGALKNGMQKEVTGAPDTAKVLKVINPG
ncbi:hypothetical protein [Pontibacter diazotrophicus]|uniref:hypothetical protein n=1 Tax=Pontibacter diazotrophicus TaxID=1400979 RepID=UPI0011C07577|nr:hypothetical protein [Pontibacter diazotrophicus]